MSRTLMLSLIAACLAIAPVAHADTLDAGAVTVEPFKPPEPAASTPGSGSGSEAQLAPAPAPKVDSLHNPAAEPVAAWDDVKAARKTSWPLAVWAGLAMLGKALAYGRERLKGVPLLGKLASWLATGKAAMVVAGFGAIGAAGYDILVSGGSLVAALVASGIAAAGVTHSTTQPPKPSPA